MQKWFKRIWLIAAAAALMIPVGAIAGSGPEAAPTASPSRLPSAAEINSIMHELSAITGFRIHRELPFASITRDQVNQYLKEQIRRSVKPDEIRAEEVTLKKFGFVPPDFDLKKTTIDLLTEQAAAFYDYRRKKLFISDWASVNMRDAALIHELGHALADQNFSIQKFTDKVADDDEASLARQAVVEGQANWLMIEDGARRNGRTMADPQTAHELLDNSPDTDSNQYPVFDNSPLYLRRTLIFPYDDGERFQEAVFLRDGMGAFARVFRDPPTTTAQILHPDRYFAHVPLASPKLPKPDKHAKPFVSGDMGELETSILLEQYVSRGIAQALSPKLKGAGYRIDETKPDHRMTLTYASEWSDAAAAMRYFDAYQQIIRAKWKNIEVSDRQAGRFAGKSEDGYFLVTCQGDTVLSEEGFDRPR